MRTMMNDTINDSNIRENLKDRTQKVRAAKRGFMEKAASVARLMRI